MLGHGRSTCEFLYIHFLPVNANQYLLIAMGSQPLHLGLYSSYAWCHSAILALESYHHVDDPQEYAGR